MKNHLLITLLSFSITPAAAWCLIRYANIQVKFKPFAWLMLSSFINEVASYISALYFHTNAVTNNVFILFECIIIFKILENLFRKEGQQFKLLIGIAIVIWVTEMILYNNIFHFTSVFRILASFMIAIVSVRLLSLYFVSKKNLVFTSPALLVPAAFSVYFSFKCFLEILYTFDLAESSVFNDVVFYILIFVNLLTNIIFFIVSLCITK